MFSLYGKDSKRLTPAMLETFDVLVYDIQDVGSRYYTFLSTLAYLIEDCAGAGKRLVVLDRPDPLGGEIIEGTTLRPGMENFVGCYPLPTRYALTIGEFAQMVNAEQHFGCDLTVVPCTGWQRGQSAPAWGTPWIMPSPNIPNYETALLYVGTCLFEGTNVSEGRGTAAPFAVIGAPYIHDAEALAAAFNARGPARYLRYAVLFYPDVLQTSGPIVRRCAPARAGCRRRAPAFGRPDPAGTHPGYLPQ